MKMQKNELPQVIALTDFEYMELIIDILQRAYRVKNMRSKTRDRRGDEARKIGMYLSRAVTLSSFPAIADVFERDHTTVLNACQRIVARMKTSDRFTAVVARFAQQVDAEALRLTNQFARVATPEQPARWWRKPKDEDDGI